MDGIDTIQEAEAHRKKLKRLQKHKDRLLPLQGVFNNEHDVHAFCNEDKCNYVNEIKESFIKNGRVPQIVDIEVFKQLF